MSKDSSPLDDALVWTSERLSEADKDAFLKRVLDYEHAPLTTDFQRLTDAGIALPEPDSLDDQQLTGKLWEVIRALDELNVVLTSTDHLSDRELYSTLWNEILRTENPITNDAGVWNVDILGGCRENDMHLYLKYYADEDFRGSWLADYPDYDMPPREKPPYDRDRHLPKQFDS